MKPSYRLSAHPIVLAPDELVAGIADVRSAKQDVGRVWARDRGWRNTPSKPDLMDTLWPILRNKIDAARHDLHLRMPEIADVVWTAHKYAQGSTFGRFGYSAVSDKTK